MENWDRLLEQVEITLKRICPSRLNPIISAYTHMNGTFYFNLTPMSPSSTRPLVNENPHNRGTWNPHGHEGWYVRTEIIHCLLHLQDRKVASLQHHGVITVETQSSVHHSIDMLNLRYSEVNRKARCNSLANSMRLHSKLYLRFNL